jgi:hypothetical protein
MAIKRDAYKDATPIIAPAHLRYCITTATLTPHDGTPVIAISAYICP